jgi:hypothetical protein
MGVCSSLGRFNHTNSRLVGLADFSGLLGWEVVSFGWHGVAKLLFLWLWPRSFAFTTCQTVNRLLLGSGCCAWLAGCVSYYCVHTHFVVPGVSHTSKRVLSGAL